MIKKGVLLILLTFVLVACGYRISGRYTGLPEHIHIVAIPGFENQTLQPDLDQILTDAVKTEFIQRGPYRIVAAPEEADAVLEGSIKSFSLTPIGVKRQNVGTTFLVMIVVDVSFTDRKTGNVLFTNPDFILREEYTFSERYVDFYLEEGPAINRAAREFASSLTSTILESFK